MSANDHPAKPLFTLLDQLWENQRRRYGNGSQVLDINMLDPLDPVHYRRTLNPEREFDYDGDMGRGYDDYMRDNNIGGRQSFVAGTFIQIADALPVIEAPSIVAELPQTQPVKTESEG